nr:unnamed protein product [Callosobruchus analis]
MVKTIDHRTIRVPLTDVVSPTYEKIVEGERMPILERYPEKGNLIIRFNIEFPAYLPKSSKEMLKKGFHLAKIGGIGNQHEVINNPTYEKIVEGERKPILERYPEKGNLIIRFNIEFPAYLPKSSKEMLKKGFHLAKIGGTGNQHEVINKLVLADKILRVNPDERWPPFDY